MKKILNINLSGRVIPIEDSAYENLQPILKACGNILPTKKAVMRSSMILKAALRN
jgi:hypothetical protein